MRASRHLAISTPSLASQICFLLLEAPFAYAHFEVLCFFQRLSSSCVRVWVPELQLELVMPVGVLAQIAWQRLSRDGLRRH
jgi:hypothetical protein